MADTPRSHYSPVSCKLSRAQPVTSTPSALRDRKEQLMSEAFYVLRGTPKAPLAYPPSEVELPLLLAQAILEYEKKCEVHEAACDAIDEYRDQVRSKRVERDAAIAEAGRLVAAGEPRPELPPAISVDDEAAEVAILQRVARARLNDANRAAAEVDKHLKEFAVHVLPEVMALCQPAIDNAAVKIREAQAASSKATGMLHQVAFWRSLALVHEIEKSSGRKVHDSQRLRLLEDFRNAIENHQVRIDRNQGRGVRDMLDAALGAIEHIGWSNPHAIPPVGAITGITDDIPPLFKQMWDDLDDEAKHEMRQRRQVPTAWT